MANISLWAIHISSKKIQPVSYRILPGLIIFLYRYAALNLAAMHARFGHQEEAFNVLNEAIMMAQEGKKNAFKK